MLPTIARLLESWHLHKVRYCHWKSTQHLPDTLLGLTDIDVLVDARMAGLAEQLLVDNGFTRFDTVPLRAYPGITDYACLDDSGTWVHVHLHYQLVLGDRWVKAYWLPAYPVLEGSRYSDQFGSYVIEGHDELYLLCARMALKFRRPFSDEKVWEELEFVRERARTSSRTESGFPPMLPILDELARCAHQSPIASRKALNRLAKGARRALASTRRLNRSRFVMYSLLRQAYRYWVEFKRRILRRYDSGRRRLRTGGAIIAFIGIDGSGKSSAVRRMEALFARQMNVERVFLGNGRSGASWYRKVFFAVLGTRAKLKGHRALNEDRDKGRRTKVPWYYAAWMLLANFDKHRNLRRAVAAKANGSLVLSDRWPQGQVPGACDGPRLYGLPALKGLARMAAAREEQLLRRATAVKPDLIVRLVVSPEAAHSRKPTELTEDEAAATAHVLSSISWQDIPVVDVDADAPMPEVDRAMRTRHLEYD